MKNKLILFILFITTRILAGPFVLGNPPMIQQINETVQPKGLVKKITLYYETGTLDHAEKGLLQETYYNISGTVGQTMYKSFDSEQNIIECTSFYEYEDRILNRVRGFWGNEEVSSLGFLPVSDSNYAIGQNIENGFSDIYNLIDWLGNLHFEFFLPLSFRGGSLVTNIHMSDDTWNREVYSPTIADGSKTIYYIINVSRNNASWEFVFSDEVYGLVHKLLVDYGEYGPNRIKILYNNGQIWEESFDYYIFDTTGNWTQVIKRTSLGEQKYFREIEYY